MNAGVQTSALDERSARKLLESIAAGDEASMAAFYRFYARRVYAFGWSRLNDPQAAADIVNEVMLVVWRTAGCFRQESRVCTWLLGIANNKVLDALRCRDKERSLGPVEDIHEVSWNRGERRVADAQYHQTIQSCVKSLPLSQRRVVHLAFFEDLSYSEIAEVLDCPPGTVKTRMYHAKLALKRQLRKYGIEEAEVD